MKKILFISSECVPFASSGGLGDVIGSLPEALKKEYGKEADIRVVLPLYGQIGGKYREMFNKICEFYVPLAWRNAYCGVFRFEKNGVTYYFLDNEYYFKRESLYGCFDDGERFAYFSKAAIETMKYVDFYPDVLHAHDWHAALSVIYLKRQYSRMREFSSVKAVFTIHNIAYQGVFGKEILGDVFGLSDEDYDIVSYDGDINLMKGAIVCADKVSTVSPTYAKEIMSPKFSHGLHYILEQNSYKLCGILNGIDRDYYNPSKDKELFANYSYMKPNGKAVNKSELQKMLGLPVKPNTPVISVISRLADHKGLDLVTLSIDDILRSDVQFVLLGKGDNYFESFFRRLAERYPDKVCVILDFNKDLAKKIYAGSDIFLMPSRSEPCGLSQMIASRYGTVPVIRETGGLYDSIHDVGCENGGNGFTFAPYSAWELYKSVERAVDCYHNTDFWQYLVKKVMKWDFSWKKSAKEYIKNLYE